MTEGIAPRIVRDVVAVCRTIGRGDDPVDFEFAAQIVEASQFPPSMLVAVACRMIVDLSAQIDGPHSVDEFLDSVMVGAVEASMEGSHHA
ncbi:hypothetical protein FR943_12935 [Mycobacterium sp. TNTM28]|uniref:Uncharacterized protein n=1 Tax=[Mycobacterium] fortunisiensis TaxID=2600579 RepID=A0ABS6KMC9_9MYCO|nr:hypothetical protein [[Mycobacterium] fortunisiensis]MBU9764748.1 hypothetical protein [[Mycobacterium] fortunisiensis]